MFHWMFENSLVALALAAVAIPLCVLLRSRPAVCHLLWLVILLRLVLPPLPLEAPGEVTALVDAGSLRLAALAGQLDIPESGIEALRLAGSFLWILGGLGVGVLQLRRCRRLQLLVRDAPPAPASLRRTVSYLAKVLGVEEPSARLLEGLSSPAVWGLGRPVLLWPSVAARAAPSRCIKGMVAHELAHIRRRDHRVAWLELGCMAVCWWNPLFWFVRRRLRLHSEEAADAWAVWALPGSRRAYADALIDVVEHHPGTRVGTPLPSAGAAERWAFRKRLRLIMQREVSHRGSPILACLAVAAALGLLPGRDVLPPEIPAAQWTEQLVGLDELPPSAFPADPARADIPPRLLPAIEAEQLRWRASAHMRNESWAQAVAACEQLLAEHTPDDGWTLRTLGRALLAQGRDELALPVLERQLATGVAEAPTLADMAAIHAARGEHALALDRLEAAFRAGYLDLERLAEAPRLEALRASAGLEDLIRSAREAQALLEQGGAAIDDRDWAGAIAAFSALRERCPGMGRAAHLLAYSLIGGGEHEEALRVCGEQLELGFAVPTALYNTACAHALLGSVDDSLDALTAAVSRGFDSWELLAEDPDLDVLRETPRMQQLLARFEKSDALRRAATKAHDSGDWEAAVEAWAALLEHAPAASKVQLRLAESLLMAGAPRSAESLLEQFVLQTRKGMDEALFQLARSHAVTGESRRALAYLESAVGTGFTDLERLRSDQLLAGLRVTDRFGKTLRAVEERRRLEDGPPEEVGA